MSSKRTDTTLISPRSALILALALLAGLGAGILTNLSADSVPASILTGSGTWSAAVIFLNTVIGRD